ncbi:MAG: hypothetical protein NTW25_04645 [Candidatus Kapabacteria bacterium]|nr:hypothetical protein [Candidatus Kapabacteria bacterium]
MNLMKNFSIKAVLLFVILAFLFTVSVEKAEATAASDCISKAINSECNEVCTNNWIYATLNTSEVIGACTYQYFIGYAYNPDCCSYYVCYIAVTYDALCPEVFPGANHNTAIYNHCMELLLDNGLLDCSPAISLVSARCWTFAKNNVVGNNVDVGNPCNGPDAVDCCKKTIVKDGNGNWVVTGTWAPLDPDCPQGCFSTCSDTYYKKNKFNSEQKSIFNENIFLASSEIDSYINISLNYSGKAKLIISDINGKNIVNSNIDLKYSTPYILNINSQDYNNIYLYRLELDGNRIITGKLLK